MNQWHHLCKTKMSNQSGKRNIHHISESSENENVNNLGHSEQVFPYLVLPDPIRNKVFYSSTERELEGRDLSDLLWFLNHDKRIYY